MRRFTLTYTSREESASLPIEGVQFSNGTVVLDMYPDNDWPGTREFRSLEVMSYHLHEFGDTSFQWLDKEAQS